MSEQLTTTIITVFGTLIVAAVSGIVTWAVAIRQDRTQRVNRQQEIEQEKAAAVREAQQQVVEMAVGMLTPLKEQNEWLTTRVQELAARLEEVEAKLKTELGEKARLLKENADLRAAYNLMSRKVQKLERFIRANIGRDINTDELDSDPNLGIFPPAVDPTPPLPTRSTFQDAPSDQPPDDAE